jgi:hypothetical protein
MMPATAWTSATRAIPVAPLAAAASDPSVEFSASAIENGQVELAQAGGIGEGVDLGDPAACDFVPPRRGDRQLSAPAGNT